MEQYEMPLGFGMALAQNPKAMEAFAKLSEDRKQQILHGTHGVHSREEMHRYVNDILAQP